MRRGQRRDPGAAQATVRHISQQRQEHQQAAAARRTGLAEVQFRQDDTAPAARGRGIVDFNISDALGSDIVINARPAEQDGYGAVIPNYTESLLRALKVPPHLKPILVPDPGGSLSNEAYKKTVRCCMACWHPKPHLSLPFRLALCDWLSRVLKVSSALHQSSLIAAEKANRDLLVVLHRRMRELNKQKDIFDGEFPSPAAAQAFREEEISEMVKLIRQVQRQPRFNALLEVGVVDVKGLQAPEGRRAKKREPYVEIALIDNDFRTVGKRQKVKHTTHVAKLDRQNNVAVWLEKAPVARVPNANVALRLKVNDCSVKVIRGPLDTVGGGKDFTRAPLEASSAVAKMLSSTPVGQVEKDLQELEQAVVPTSLTFQLTPAGPGANPVLGCLGCGGSSGGSGQQQPSGPNGRREGAVGDDEDTGSSFHSQKGAGQLSVVLRFFQEQLGSKNLRPSARPTPDDGTAASDADEPLQSPKEAVQFMGTRATEGEGGSGKSTQDLLGGLSISAPAPPGDGDPNPHELRVPESSVLDAFPSSSKIHAPQEMAEEEEVFDQVLAVIWGAWQKSPKEHCINDAEVIDERHNKMLKKMHTFYLDAEESRVGWGVNDEPDVTYPAGDMIFSEVPSLLHHLVRDVPLPGLAPDKSWWAVVQLVATRCRVRKQRRDLGVLCMLIKEWHVEFGYLRAVRGIFQHLVAGAAKSQLTWRELFLLRESNAAVCKELGVLFEHGPSKLLKMSFDEAGATFQEMQKLLLLASDGDGADWTPSMDSIMLHLMGRGAAKRLRDVVPDNPKDIAFTQAVIRNISTCTDELRVDATLSHASLSSSPRFAEHGAYVRYGVIKEQLMQHLQANRPVAYTSIVQVLEDTLYQHHYALHDKNLIGSTRQLVDPLGKGPPIQLVDVEEVLEQPILAWIADSEKTTLGRVENTLKMQREASGVRKVVYNLNASLLEMLQSVQESLTRVSRRGMRATLPSRRYRVGQAMTDTFEAAIQMYSRRLCADFVQEVQGSSSGLWLWAMRLGADSTMQSSEEPPRELLSDEMAVSINSLWLLLSNHHEVERSIQTSVIKGLPFEAVQIDVDQFNLEAAQTAIQRMEEGQLGGAEDGPRTAVNKENGNIVGGGGNKTTEDDEEDDDDDISIVSESFSWDGENQGDVQESVARMMEKMRQAQHGISNQVISMVSSIANAFTGTISSLVQGLLLQAHKNPPREVLVDDSLSLVCNALSRELRILNSSLNNYAFQLVLQTTWYSILVCLENGVLHTDSPWILTNDNERGIVDQVLESLVSVWHAGGEGLPEGLIDRTSHRLRTLLKLHESPAAELRRRYESLTNQGGVSPAGGSAALGDLVEGCNVRFAQQNVTLLGTYLIARSTLPVGGQDLLRLLRQRQGDSKARAAVEEADAQLGPDEIQAHLSVTSTETLVCASEATLRQREVTGKLLVFTDHIVFTNILSMGAGEDFRNEAMQAASAATRAPSMPPRVEPIGTLDAATAAERGTLGLVSRALSSAAVPRMRSPAVREVIRRSEVLGAVQKNHQVQLTAASFGLEYTFTFSRKGDADKFYSNVDKPRGAETGFAGRRDLMGAEPRHLGKEDGGAADTAAVRLSLADETSVPMREVAVPPQVAQALGGACSVSVEASLVKQIFFAALGTLHFGSEALVFSAESELLVLRLRDVASAKLQRDQGGSVTGMLVVASAGERPGSYQFNSIVATPSQSETIISLLDRNAISNS